MTLACSRLAASLAAAAWLVAVPARTAGAQAPGETLYVSRCAACHDKDVPRAPRLDVLRQMSPEAILGTLQGGTMLLQARGLTLAEKQAIAVYVAGSDFSSVAGRGGRCSANAAGLVDGAPEWSGWGAGPENARFQPKPGLEPTDLNRLRVRWAFGFPGSILAYGAPVVAGGRVFVGSAGGELYALDARTGCVHWSHTAEASVRAAPSVGRLKDGRAAVFFADQSARLYALDATRGTLLWQTVVDDQIAAAITGSPKLHDGRLYVPVSVLEDILTPDPRYPCCRSRGALAAVDAETGRVLWKSHSIAEPATKVGTNSAGTERWGPSGASVWNSPTIDAVRGAVYVGTGNNHSNPPTGTSDAILAFDMATGRLLWTRQLTPGGDAWNIACGMNGPNCPENAGPDHDVGASPILRTLPGGRRVLIAGAKSSKVHALDPDKNGEVIWVQQLGLGGALGGIEWGMAADDTAVYVPLSDLAFGTDMMAGKMSPTAGGGLFAYRFTDGTRLWHAPPIECGTRSGCSPAQSQAATAIPGAVFSGTIGGLLRAYSSDDGRALWEFDTVRDFETVNGVKARGGTLNGAGPVVAGGLVLVGSGYGRFGQLPGNVLICLSVDGR
jgi:polyvinyl alcohol dehydrogenase (cytochrome)